MKLVGAGVADVYLVYWVHSRQLPQSGHTEDLHDQVSSEQV